MGGCRYLSKLNLKVGKRQHRYHSLDLKSATDRFPIDFQMVVVSKILGPEKAKMWKDILIKYPYNLIQGDGKVNYNAGQPMGAYSSWAIFTLTHHLIIR